MLALSVKKFYKEETVLAVATTLAIISAFLIIPDKEYVSYIDFRTLGILFSLMAVMAGLQEQGMFEKLGKLLIARTNGVLELVLVLVGLCLFGSMIITNDVALITFVPFTFTVLNYMGKEIRNKLLIPVVCMQTIAANLGSMMTPIGNPQNLYLYGQAGMKLSDFVLMMLPYAALSAVLLIGWAFFLCRGYSGKNEIVLHDANHAKASRKIVAMYLGLFLICLLAVARIIPYYLVFALVLLSVFATDRVTLKNIDYSLLLTFIAFFIFIGNLGRIDIFSHWLEKMISGREVVVAVLSSQITSNVPAALLLSGFTDNVKALLIGTNLGGLGTLIASMASLISFRQIAKEEADRKGKYFLMFTESNIVFLVILMAFWAILMR